LFVADGRLVVSRLVAHGDLRLRSLLLTTAACDALGAVCAATAPDVPVYVAPHAVMNGVVGFNIHRGCVAIAERPAMRQLCDMDLAQAGRVVVAEGVNNPDNIGGLFRNAAALGADAVLLGPGSGDPLYRKAIRTSMAATLLLPWARAEAWPEALDTLKSFGLTVVACSPDAGVPSLYAVPLPRRAAVLVGAEGDGLSPEALAAADLRVRIPMSGAMDSLNVATATAVVLSALAAREAGAAPTGRPRPS
jgi:tRNA G18 (ribose-2'-O)-methylase SpoU